MAAGIKRYDVASVDPFHSTLQMHTSPVFKVKPVFVTSQVFLARRGRQAVVGHMSLL